jgi:hypothetical protein
VIGRVVQNTVGCEFGEVQAVGREAGRWWLLVSAGGTLLSWLADECVLVDEPSPPPKPRPRAKDGRPRG